MARSNAWYLTGIHDQLLEAVKADAGFVVVDHEVSAQDLHVIAVNTAMPILHLAVVEGNSTSHVLGVGINPAECWDGLCRGIRECFSEHLGELSVSLDDIRRETLESLGIALVQPVWLEQIEREGGSQ